jgi:predicted methyltransferase
VTQHRSLTGLAHGLLGALLAPGDLAIDATAGNGHDTLFLAQRVSPGGRVYAFDVQAEALRNTAARLSAAKLSDAVTLCQQGHQTLLERLPNDWIGRVAAVTFNLGYLPGSDKTTTTLPHTTLAALDHSLAVLRPGGALSVLVYRGHSGGQDEAQAVAQWLADQAPQLTLQTHESAGPLLHFAHKRG